MSDAPRSADDDVVLARMLRDAEALCAGKDLLLAGQYHHLRERIRALIELRRCFEVEDDA
jgi:hypothetical protein